MGLCARVGVLPVVRRQAVSLANSVGVPVERWKPGKTMAAEEILALRGTLYAKADTAAVRLLIVAAEA